MFDKILKIQVHLLLADTDDVSFQSLVTEDKNSLLCKDNVRYLIIEIFLSSKLKVKIDLSVKYFDSFDAPDRSLHKQVGIFEF